VERRLLAAETLGAAVGVGTVREQQSHHRRAVREIARPVGHNVQRCPIAAFASFDLHVWEIGSLGQQAAERSQITGVNRRSRGNCQGIVSAH
jgi:hypothetical protein